MDANKKFKLYGHYEYKGALKGNSVIADQAGPNTVSFTDGQTITFNLPPVRLSGLLYGARLVEWHGTMQFKDETRDLMGKLTFYENNNLFSKNLHPSDYFE